jgi:predicted nucleic acid-binding Zn ribbon protein
LNTYWHNGDVAWEPLPGSGQDPVDLGAGLTRVLRSLDAPAPTTLGTLFEEWTEIVGDRMAAHVRPVRLRGTTLLLSVNEPGWAAQVRWMASELLERLDAGLGPGVVTEVEVRVDAGSQRP